MFVSDILLDAVIRGALFAAVALLWVIVLVRIVGLRSFSKMTAFDFVATLATGSLVATAATASEAPQVVQPLVAIAAIFAFQFVVALARQRSDGFRRLLDNTPRLLYRDGGIDEQALRETRVARADVLAKLREANATQVGEVRAVVLETTGDISVLYGDPIDDALIDDVR